MTRTATWESIGTDVEGANSLNDVLIKAHLNYEVATRPLEVNVGLSELVKIPDKLITYDTTTRKVFGIVGKNYQICQNAEAFDFVNYIDEDITFKRAGQTTTGMVYIIAALPDVNILGDKFTPYVIFQNSHNGMYTVKTTICPLRFVCRNQFNYSFAEFTNTVAMKHNGTLEYKMADAKLVMTKSAEYMQALNNDLQRFADTKVSEKNLPNLINAMFPITPDMTELSKERIAIQRNQFIQAYNADDNQNFRKTLMGLINAEADYLTHRVPNRKAPTYEERQFLSVTFDPKAMNNFIAMANDIMVAV